MAKHIKCPRDPNEYIKGVTEQLEVIMVNAIKKSIIERIELLKQFRKDEN